MPEAKNLVTKPELAVRIGHLPPRVGEGLGVRLVDGPCPAQVRRIDLGALPMIEAMHRNGIRVDKPHFAALQVRLEERLREIDGDIELLVGDEYPGFQATSPDQVADLLFERLRLKLPGKARRTEKGTRFSTEDEALSGIRNQHPVVDCILDHREISKLLDTYVVPMPGLVDPDGRLRTVFKPVRTRTGRLACGDRSQGKKNLQNIPTRGDWGAEVRNGFWAAPGCVLVSLDLSQIEMRLAGHLSGEPNMIGVFVRGEDIHTSTAIAMFRLVPGEVLGLLQAEAEKRLTPEQAKALKEFKHKYRLPAKTLGFAVLYGVSPLGLQKQILNAGGPFLSEQECADYIERWFNTYPGVLRFLRLQYERVRRYGMNWTAFGRVRLIPEVKCVSRDKVNEGDREAGNHPIQGTAADLLKIDMWELWRALLQVHDELIVEASAGIATEFADWGREVMRTSVRLDVPVDSSSDIAERWGCLK
jgi:DNA polymerase I